MSKEISLLLPLLEDYREEAGRHFGRLGTKEIVVVQSGIGKVNAALAANDIIDAFRPSLVINTGVAGGVGVSKPLDVIIPQAVAYHDVWCGPGTVWGQADNCPARFECLIPPAVEPSGLLASGDIFISKTQEVEHILRLYPDAVAVDMESAAIAQACYLKNVDFACIRVVSDTPGSADNIAQYESFWEAAPRATFAALTTFLSAIQ